MIALDTNMLVYAQRKETENHAAALKLIRGLAEGEEPWGLPWPCVYEFLRVVTHGRVFDPPTKTGDAMASLQSLFESPSLVLMGEGPVHPAHMARMVESGRVSGNLAHDAHIAALAVEHGVGELWTTDRDFSRFQGLRIRNPFLDPPIEQPDSDASRAKVRLMEGVLQRFRDEMAARQVDLLAVVIPSLEHVMMTLDGVGVEGGHDDRLAAILDGLGIRYVPLQPDILRHSDPVSLYDGEDPHLSVEGCAVAAGAIRTRLTGDPLTH